jgi:hypothetical protein
MGGEQRRQNPEGEGSHETVSQRLFVVSPREAQDHQREHQRVVGAQQPLQEHEQADRDEV